MPIISLLNEEEEEESLCLVSRLDNFLSVIGEVPD